MTMRIRVVLLALAMVGLLVGCVTTKDGDQMKQEIITLQTRVDNLQTTVTANQAQLEKTLEKIKKDLEQLMHANQITTASDRANLERMLRDLRMMNGMIEKNGYDLQQSQRTLEQMIAEMESRIRHLEAKLGITPPKSGSDGAKAPATPTTHVKPGEDKTKPPAAAAVTAPVESGQGDTLDTDDPKAFYQYAKTLIREKNQLVAGRQMLATFLKNWPKHALADNAQFWIAETYFMEKNYHQAVMTYQKVVDNYAKGDAVDDAYWMMGECFRLLGMPEDAKAFYQETVDRYPNTNSAAKAKKALKKLGG